MGVSPAKIVQSLLTNPADPELVKSLTTPDVTYVSLNENNPDLKAILPWTGTNKGPETIAGPAGLFQVREHVVADGLMSYGVSLSDLFRMGALYTDKILRGTKPEDLPIAQPVSFEFVINLKTAKAIGLEIAATVIARADEVIE